MKLNRSNNIQIIRKGMFIICTEGKRDLITGNANLIALANGEKKKSIPNIPYYKQHTDVCNAKKCPYRKGKCEAYQKWLKGE